MTQAVTATDPQESRPSLLERMARGLANPSDWSNADKCLLASLIVLVMVLFWNAWDYYSLVHHGEIPYVHDGYAEHVLPLHLFVFSGGWLLIVLASLWARRHAPDTRLLVHVLIQFYAVGFSLVTYVYGTFTTNFAGSVLLGGVAVGFLLFDKGPMLAGITTAVALLVVTTVASQLGVLPYAPFMAGAPYEGGRLSNLWLESYGLLNYTVFFLVVGLVYFIFYRWRDRERKLAVATEQLGRANELISRYVAAQVSQSILAGDYEAVARHSRRKLTVFFSDIKDFTSTAELMEPEDLSEVLNEYLTEMTIIAEKHGGTIDKFVGDAVMIFFGAPTKTSDRDHALRAARMAVEMQHRMVDLREKWRDEGNEHPFHIRIGINTGRASIGNFGSEGRMDYTAIGRQVNLAARLEVNCEPDRVLISHATWALVKDEIPCTPKGEITVKGVRDPVKVYEVNPEEVNPEEVNPEEVNPEEVNPEEVRGPSSR